MVVNMVGSSSGLVLEEEQNRLLLVAKNFSLPLGPGSSSTPPLSSRVML